MDGVLTIFDKQRNFLNIPRFSIPVCKPKLILWGLRRLPTTAHRCTIHPTPKLKSSTWTTAKPSSYKITTSEIFIFLFLFVLNKNKVWKMPGKHVVGIFADFRREGKSCHSNRRISIINVAVFSIYLLIKSKFLVTYDCTLSCRNVLI